MNLHNNTSGGLFVKVAGDKIKQARKLKKSHNQSWLTASVRKQQLVILKTVIYVTV